MEKVNWKVDGMTCTNCALSIQKYLEKKGATDVKVNFIGGDVSFEIVGQEKNNLAKGISDLGYSVKGDEVLIEKKSGAFFKNPHHRFWFCFAFTLPLLVHMIPGVHIHFLMNPWVQLFLTIPVYIIGIEYFGKSAWQSLKNRMPDMNVLIAIGATAAFVYSIIGMAIGQAQEYMFFETTATIITLVLLGNWMEDKSVEATQSAIRKLSTSQKIMAHMIAFDEHHQEQIFEVEAAQLKVGDLLLIKNGEQVPIDCKILSGEAEVNEAIITGESLTISKKMNDFLIGGSVLENGTVKTMVTAAGNDTVLSNILKMVKEAQAEKPPVQQLADKISAVFVPVVIGIALITLGANYFFAQQSFSTSLLRSIAVLVISCPCAMGLATPAAIAVGLGRAAKNGILFKNARSLEVFKDIKQVVFDKTGTLTTGNFSISNYYFNEKEITENDFKNLAFSIEKYSNHPIATSISKEWKTTNDIRWNKMEELKGLGMKAADSNGNIYMAASYKAAAELTNDLTHNVYIIKNNTLLGWIDVTDEIRTEAKQVIDSLYKKGIKTVLLSGDKKEKCNAVAEKLGINEVIAEQSPEEKLIKIAFLNSQLPTAMVGDGINDAPALAKATVGISLSDASQVAMQIAQVVLMNHGLKNLPLSLGLGKHTYITIKENLFWAFIYNIIAIPVAAFGYLNPTFGALIMGLSDVVLAINSIRLNFKKV